MAEQATAQLANAAVLSPPVEGALLQRKCACGSHTIAEAECESCKKGRAAGDPLQRAAAHPGEVGEVPPIVNEVLNSSGQPLDAASRSFFEQRFGRDFSHVRVHTDAKAAESARAVHALAYTVGRDLVFATGEYRPQASEGRRLLAHELAHAVQQRNTGHNPGLQHRLRVSDEDDPAEREADEMAARSLASPVPPASAQQTSQVTATKFNPVTAPTMQRRVSASMGTIKHNLTYRVLDWAITDKEARQVLEILKVLSDQDLKDTVAEMEKEGLVDRLFSNLADEDIKGNQEALIRIKNARVYKEVTKKDGKKVTTTTTGSCSPDQNREISGAVKEALVWLDKAIAQVGAYLAKPKDASTKATLDALTAQFKSATANVATYVRGQLSRLQTDLRNRNSVYSFECHEDWDLICGKAGAYVPGNDREKVVFCTSFFDGGNKATEWQIETVLHEIAHTQVGGAHIGDRAYASNRMLKQLTTEEALTNAESYGLFIQQLVSGKAPESSAPEDTFEDCPKEWKPALAKALARAQRWNRDAQVSIAKLTPAKAKAYGKDDIALIGGTTQKNIDSLQKAVDGLADELNSSINFECEPKGGGRCDKGAETYWYAAGDFHICPAWMQKSPDQQVVGLLAGLYGYKGGVDDNTRRFNYAHFAQSRATGSAPALPNILGNAAWRPDAIRIRFYPQTPKTGAASYLENGSVHERMSDDLPEYQVPLCYSRALPFEASVHFYVDRQNMTRPAPFTPPSVSVEFRYMSASGPTTKAVSDPRADYSDRGDPLNMKFEPNFKFDFNRNGPFWMKFEMKDADTGVNRVYEDTIQVDTQRPCDMPDKPPKKQYA